MDSGGKGQSSYAPAIIRFPFEKGVRNPKKFSLIKLSMNIAVVPESFGSRAVRIGGNISIKAE